MRAGEALTEDAVGVAEFSGTAVSSNPEGYQVVVAADAHEAVAARTHLLATVTTVLDEPDLTVYARVAVDAAAERIARAGNLQSPVALRGALEQAVAEVQRLGLASPSGSPPGLALIGISLIGGSYAVARTPDAMAYIVGIATERVFGVPVGNAADRTMSAGPTAARGTAPAIELRRGQLEPGSRIVLLTGPGWKNIEPHRIGAVVRSAEPDDAAQAILQLARDRSDDPLTVAVVAPVGLDRPTLTVVDDAGLSEPRRPTNSPFETDDIPTGASRRAARSGGGRRGTNDGGGPIWWPNINWVSPVIAAFLIGGVIGAVLGESVGKVGFASIDPLNDRYLEIIAQLASNNPPEEPGLVYERLRALGPAGEPDAIRRVAAKYSGSADAAQRDLAPRIAALADIAERGPQPVTAPPPQTAVEPPPNVRPGASPAATARPGVTVASPVAGSQPAPLPPQPATQLTDPTATPGAEPARAGRISPNLTESVNMRIRPQRSASLVQQIRPGTAIEILETVEGDAVEGTNTTWYRVRVGQVEGFVYSRFVVAG